MMCFSSIASFILPEQIEQMQMFARARINLSLQANLNIPYKFTGPHLLDLVFKVGMKARNAMFLLADPIVVTQIS